MEQLRIRADRFRKQGRLQDIDLEEIIADIKGADDLKANKAVGAATGAGNDKHLRVLEVVEDGLLQTHGIAPNTKQQGIFCIMGENCNGFSN